MHNWKLRGGVFTVVNVWGLCETLGKGPFQFSSYQRLINHLYHQLGVLKFSGSYSLLTINVETRYSFIIFSFF